MTHSELTALLLFCTAVSFTPGPNTTLSTTLAANFGLRGALRFVFAVPVGWGLLFTLCALGLGAVVAAAPVLQGGITWVGVGYMLWLAFKLSQSGGLSATSSSRFTVTFWQGVGLQFVNIKAWMLALSVVAGFIAGRPQFAERYTVVLIVMLAFATVSNLAYALVGSVLRNWLAKGQRLLAFNRVMALVLVVTAIWMTRL